ncbi:alpha-methylacyl-coa racemase [Colletotrichum scovillei]|uniref:Alpha-methylacyl-coa racemase n=1 Tax=Colletotrichum scovillei TaxID=1209932 RepID=A0A9P7RIR0_9PEZI|nr:alpha-methylacyl-coa racemase [Colletotrichum scovillei]KAG7076311.1 alpha-methylacyl-coa racemase [Colletotrichum scovillei]KAG7083425.1 alpha-methylacyl-coa racemase [Colletotrichum scovillei]
MFMFMRSYWRQVLSFKRAYLGHNHGHVEERSPLASTTAEPTTKSELRHAVFAFRLMLGESPCPRLGSPSSPAATAKHGVSTNVTAGLWSPSLAGSVSSSRYSNTGVQHASVPSKTFSHSSLVRLLKILVNNSRSSPHLARSNLSSSHPCPANPSPLINAAKNCGSSAPTAKYLPSFVSYVS